MALPSYDWQQSDYHWYRTGIPARRQEEGKHVLLVLEQAMFGTEVRVNGSLIGGDIGCYTSQRYDITEALLNDHDSELLVRVGARQTLPPESAAGRDQERQVFIPGIWGDVRLETVGIPSVRSVQMIPHINEQGVEARIFLENPTTGNITARLHCRIKEAASDRVVGTVTEVPVVVHGGEAERYLVEVPLHAMRLWSPDDPFLYWCTVEVQVGERIVDACSVRFGMREFQVLGDSFYLNGNKVFLRGGNIAFHRFLSDDQRKGLPWDQDWIKQVLIDIPKEHSFNFFRNHIGQMYNRWYDIADEYGMLLQNEWQFWTTSGTKEQIIREFTQWIEDNCNHPSIVIWDPLNECTDRVVQEEIVPLMKSMDPTRPWESVDFVEEHPYIYSLGPVLIDRKFGFTRGLHEIEASATPSMLNEFVWWWLDRNGRPTSLMEGVVERWLGPFPSQEELFAHQSFLATELIELFRRMRVKAIQPFVYLSNNNGPTAHWFLGDIRDLRPKPILAALKNAFAPFGVSLELWDRHFFPGERRTVRLFVFNDGLAARAGVVRIAMERDSGRWENEQTVEVDVTAASFTVVPVSLRLPDLEGAITITAELRSERTGPVLAQSRKPGFVLQPPHLPPGTAALSIALAGSGDAMEAFLLSTGIHTERLTQADLRATHAVIIPEGEAIAFADSLRAPFVEQYVGSGGTLVLLEPEYGIDGTDTVRLLGGLDLHIVRREDADKGGYDSYIIPNDIHHRVWDGITPEQLRMFNGGFGGEIVSQHDVTPGLDSKVHARCGLHLTTAALMDIAYGEGHVVISRIQVRGRLHGTPGEGLYARRLDPVAQRYLMNLLVAFQSRIRS